MGNFKKRQGKRFGGFGGGSGRRIGGRGGFGGDRDRGPVTMHQAICNKCGKPCEVPFRPTGGKPIYCNDCFEGKRETGTSRGADRFSQRNYDSYKASVKPDFRSDIGKGDNGEIEKQLEALNEKMDRLIKAVEAMAIAKSLVSEGKNPKNSGKI
jgi:CxxC-x17-CxxC domain-containing protein